jgi:DNA invertase Pin-like site-specific DNA recombinase
MLVVLIGYARVLTGDQDLALQLDALKAAGCARCFSDTASGSIAERPQLNYALEELRDGEDTLVVWRLDRLGRSLRHLIELVGELERRQLGFRSLTEGIDTTSSSGRLVFHIFAAIAEFERQLIAERTRAGLQAARARGRLGGRPTTITEYKLLVAREMLDGGQHTMGQIAATIGVSRATLYRHLDRSRTASSPPARAAPSAALSAAVRPAVASGQASAPAAQHFARGWRARRCPVCGAEAGEGCLTPAVAAPHAPTAHACSSAPAS